MLTNKEIEEKQEYLKKIGTILKNKYYGIDMIIDKVLEQIETWYIFDELLYQPSICILIGSTSCGKTTLVKDLVKLLNMFEKFAEVDLSKPYDDTRFNFRGGPIASKIYSVINDTDEKCILLIDEIQKIKENPSYNELWNLLSEGKIGSGHISLNKIDNIVRVLNSFIENYNDTVMELEYMKNAAGDSTGFNMRGWNPSTQPIPMGKRYVIKDYLDAVKIENIDDLQPLFDFHDFNPQNTGFIFGFSNILRNAFDNGKITIQGILEIPNFVYIKPLLEIAKIYRKSLIDKYSTVVSKDPMVLSKMLIFITGNIDGLYVDSKNTDISADELHQKTLKLTVEDLKTELLKIFRPDEVSRLGGNFIIYPSLSSEAFTSIITDKLKQIEIDVEKISDIKITLRTDKYLKHLYNTSVVASLGARPTISKVYTEINSLIPILIKKAKSEGLKSISINKIDFTQR